MANSISLSEGKCQENILWGVLYGYVAQKMDLLLHGSVVPQLVAR